MAGSRPPLVRCYGSAVAYSPWYNGGTDASTPTVRPVYDEYDSDDNKVFTGHGHAILPMTVTCDDDDAPQDDLFTSVAAAMAAEQQRGTPVAAVEHGASDAGSATACPPPVPCYGGTAADGHQDGWDAATRPPLAVRSGSDMSSNQYVYDCEEFPMPGPGVVIESTVQGNTTVPMTMTPDDGEDDAPRPVEDDFFASVMAAMAAEQQLGTPVAAGDHGDRTLHATMIEPTSRAIVPITTCDGGAPPPAYDDLFPGGLAAQEQHKTPVAATSTKVDHCGVVVDAGIKDGGPGVEVDGEKELEEILYDESLQKRGRRSRRRQETTAARNINEASPSAWVAAGIAAAAEHGRRLTAAAARFTTVRRLVRRGGGEAKDTQRRGNS
jgi:hypothetical protein